MKAGDLGAGDLEAGVLKAGSLVEPTPVIRVAAAAHLVESARHVVSVLRGVRDRQYKDNRDVLDAYLEGLRISFTKYLWLQQCAGLIEADEEMNTLAASFEHNMNALKIRLEVLRGRK